MRRRSIGTPLTVGIVMVLLLLLLAAGWQVLVLGDFDPRPGPRTLDWLLLIFGSLFFLLLLAGLVWLCLWLIQEMRLNQRQRAFVDAVTHELKTPLASFRLYLDTLGRHDLEPQRRDAFITHMREDLDRLDHTVAQVLSAARAEERSRARPAGAVEIGPLLEGCIEEVSERNRLPEGAVVFTRRVAAGVRGDAAELGIVFRNLLENAIKYSQDPVDVRVGLRDTGDGRVRVEIEDSGIGIPSNELRKIFQRFYRTGREVQRKSGLGLGLFIVRGLLRRHGGRVVAQSAGAGRGSRFVVTLRAAPSATG